jgi:hypothetical protein
MRKKRLWVGVLIVLVVVLGLAYASNYTWERARSTVACIELALDGFRSLDKTRDERFLGKVKDFTALCRGGDKAVRFRDTPWVDWASYWGAGDASSRASTRFESFSKHLGPNDRGIDGALLDLEYQRLELIAFNLHDPNTYEDYIKGRGKTVGPVLTKWKEMRLRAGDPHYAAVGGDGEQVCKGELIRHRTLTGICNDVLNPRMGSAGMLFARNAQFEETFVELGGTSELRNRHGDRIGPMKPDPQVISRRLFTREQAAAEKCRGGLGLEGNSEDAQCDYQKAPFFNVLAAFWIQFMTHDWFGHLDEGRNAPGYMKVGCETQRVNNVETPLSNEEAKRLGCRKGDRIQKALLAETGNPGKFSHDNREYLRRPYSTTRNHVTAWWDASQIYGYNETSLKRVKRDPGDRARLLLRPVGNRPGDGEKQGYLPLLSTCRGADARPGCEPDPMNPLWSGQEATAFPDNWTIGMSFYHNVFAREHNAFVGEFRRRATEKPEEDSGLRNPSQPDRVIRYRDVTDDELFEAARLVVAAEIAKIHTTEWTPQLLYDEPLFLGMNANWGGFFEGHKAFEIALERIVKDFRKSGDPQRANQLYSVLASGPGIVGLGSHDYGERSILSFFKPKKDVWSIKNLETHVNGGVNHFGSPFNFPEEFITVYRLHPLVPDLIEYREWNNDPNKVREKLPVISTFRGPATQATRSHGLANMALSMGRQRLGLLTLRNHPVFLQNLPMPHLNSETKTIDVAALDLIRDRERGIPRFNEFRRQYGLQSLTSFDDFVDEQARPAEQERQRELIKVLREVYGQHRCDNSKVITRSQSMKGTPITDCLGHPNGTMVDNVEDVDVVVGFLSEFRRPHGFAISETQFVVFILNASRRLFSDRFFTSSFRPEFYTHLGVAWVTQMGPDKRMERGRPNGHEVEVSPLKRVLLRTIPELAPELDHVVNAFDPWARDRGDYYSLEWTPRAGANSDPAFLDTK